jgi:hypothetical protein
MVYIDRLFYLAIKSLDGVEHESILDWRLEIKSTYKRAQQSVQRIAFGAGAAGFLVGVVVTLVVMSVQIGVR